MEIPQSPKFLALPLELRQRIYKYILAPDLEDVTTINYRLVWPHLQNPDSLTFTPYQLDLCGCAKQSSKHHIYTRHVCQGPQVRFFLKDEPLWILHECWGMFNILRPASQEELERRPSATVARVSRQVYCESLPILYRGRNFRLLSGPCPRGRYQAYATRKWLSRLSPIARSNITDLSLICQSYEEDSLERDAVESYSLLSHYILTNLPRFETLHLIQVPTYHAVHPFGTLFNKLGTKISVTIGSSSGEMTEFYESQLFLAECAQRPYADTMRSRSLPPERQRGIIDVETMLEDSLSLRQ